MEIGLALLGETVDLLEPCTSNATLEDTVILFCVHVERLVVDRRARLERMGRRCWVLGKGGLGIAVRRGGWLVIGRWRGTVVEVVEVRRVELVLDNGV
jgi:hypothetical protein